jgi:predicted alpha/beta hydrolase family esterase
MQKRVFIIHGWGGNPEEGWYPWVKAQLEQRGFLVTVLEMPDTEHPQIRAWVGHLQKTTGEVDEQTFFIGHSIGCQTILRFLETVPEGKVAGGVVFVAGWFHLMGLEEEELLIAEPWVNTPIDVEKVRVHAGKIRAIFSDNDSVVPLTEKDIFEKELQATCIILHDKGHFSGDDGINELPEALIV